VGIKRGISLLIQADVPEIAKWHHWTYPCYWHEQTLRLSSAVQGLLTRPHSVLQRTGPFMVLSVSI